MTFEGENPLISGAVVDRKNGQGVLRRAITNRWTRFSIRRLISLGIALCVLAVAIFLSVRLIPGDPVSATLGTDASPQERQRLRIELGLDRPAYEQFATYIENLVRGNLGRSFRTNQPVADILGERLVPSAQLAGTSLVLTLGLGIPIGILVGMLTEEGRRRRLDVVYQAVTQITATLPEFLFATVLAYVFAVRFQLLPAAGSEGWQTMVLPVAALSTVSVASMSRFVRVETLNVLAQDYIRTARIARLPARIIFLRHVLPNVLTAALTIGGLIFAGVIGGAVIIENVFNRPGLGTAITTAMAARDYPVIQGSTLALGIMVVVVNTAVDVVLAVIDKRSLLRS